MDGSGVRALLLGLVFVGIAGLATELFLMEHYDSWSQIAPLIVLGVGLAAGASFGYRPTPARVRVFQAVMGSFVLIGLAGLWLHYRGNLAFEMEVAPATKGLALVWSALRGAVPTLAPGALVQLGLLGLILSHRHPALHPRVPTPEGEEDA